MRGKQKNNMPPYPPMRHKKKKMNIRNLPTQKNTIDTIGNVWFCKKVMQLDRSTQ